MADTAHRLTDEKLEEMENRLSAIYSMAEKEIGEAEHNCSSPSSTTVNRPGWLCLSVD